MSEPFIAEIRQFSFDFPPRGWARCDGQLLPINQNQALFSLLGTTYGGNGQTTFALPDLRGRSPMHVGSLYSLGSRVGTETVTLTVSQMPAHNHVVLASTAAADNSSPNGSLPAAPAGHNIYGGTPGTVMTNVVEVVGGGQPFNNLQPYLVINFCIALQGIFPSRS